MNRTLRKLFSNVTSLMGIILLILFVVIAIFAPIIAPPLSDDPYQVPRMSWDVNPQPPGSTMSDEIRDIYDFMGKEIKYDRAICGTA
ncbi:unnamed protein product, partial [marine sediment metagenome]